tara:strand:+ start:143 stop:2065 length:1923 start_codon:yes stop_codon:yes gene_type:complete
MTEKILITTKQGYDFSSDSTGGNLINILIAEYLQNTTNFRVELYEPFYDLLNNVNTKFKVITELPASKLGNYDRILDPFFYISALKNNSSKTLLDIFTKKPDEIYVEGRTKWNNYFDIKKKNIQLIQKNGFMASNSDDVNLYYKALPSPYTHYYELLYRDKFISNLKLKKKIKIPLLKKKLTFSIQIRPIHHNKVTIKDNLNTKEYFKFILSLIKKINNDFNFPNILFFGVQNEEFKRLIKTSKKKISSNNLFLLENYSNSVLENSLTLAENTDYLISSLNGFTAFTYFIGSSQGKIKKKFIINSVKGEKEHIISRRILQDGINENNADWKWFKTFIYLPKDTILKINKERFLEYKKNNFNQKKNIKLVVYETDELVRNYFSKNLDKILLTELISYLKKTYNRHVILLSKKKNKVSKKIFSIIEKNLNVLTHFNLIDNTNNKTLGYGSLDFIKHDFTSHSQKKGSLSPSHYLYEDLSFFLIRQLLKKKNSQINYSKKKIKKILLIVSSENELKNLNKFLKIIKKFKLDINYVYISREKLVYQNEEKMLKFDLNKKNINKLISKNDCLICSDNHLSLFFNYFCNDKKIFFYFKNKNKKIFSKIFNLFQITNNLTYKKLYSNVYNNYYEIFLEITKQFIKRF